MQRVHQRSIGLAAPLARTTPQARQQRAARTPSRPNIVWISNEDMGARLGAYGDRLARTPVLDRLAKASIRYTHAFTTAPGPYLAVPRFYVKAFPEYLRAAGYFTSNRAREPDAAGVARDQLADGDRDLRSHPGRIDR